MAVIAKNPVMPGFYPDPSICKAGEDYYLIHSSFAYFPGLPLFHSKDLAHWEQVGNVMERSSQLPLSGCGHSQGLYAPTIRYHDGVYYVICTNISGGGNFIVTSPSPQGPWSEPYYLPEAGGIDPSLFFDEDGKCYYIGTHPNPDGCRYDGDWYIWMQELDIGTMRLVGEPKDVWNGAMRGVIWPEGPHLYKKDGYYYIMHAEGGTGPDHAIAICRSWNLFGPYENNRKNPILTHRHLGKSYPVQYVGHGDLVETPAGDWYMVMLAVRPQAGYTTMGRETFLARVVWEDGWPVVNPGVGRLTEQLEITLPEWDPQEDPDSFTNRGGSSCLPGSSRVYDFTKMEQLGGEWLFLRNPQEGMYVLSGDGLHLTAGTATLRELESPSYIAVRQQHQRFRVTVALQTEQIMDGVTAGLALVQNQDYQLRLEVSEHRIQVMLANGAEDCCVASALRKAAKEKRVEDRWITLFLDVNHLWAAAGLIRGQEEEILASEIPIHMLSTEVAGGFVGCTAGIYAAQDREAAKRQEAEGKTRICFGTFSYQNQE